MSRKIAKLEADIAIIGGGPGGCVLAKDLSKNGKRVILVEQGSDSTRFFGTPMGLALGGHVEMGKRLKMRKTMEKQTLVLGKGIGGGTKLYSAIAFLPDLEAFRNVGIDLSPYIDTAIKETWANEVPDEFLGPETRRLVETAAKFGHHWERFMKHIDFDKCDPSCTKCNSGCPRGAKWTGKVAADEAVKHGANVITRTRVRNVITDNGTAVGILAKGNDGQRYEITANTVVCSAGGIGTVPILKRVGIYQAGNNLAGDPSVLMFGFVNRSTGFGYEHQQAVGSLNEDLGVLLSTGMPTPRSSFFLLNAQKRGIRRAFRSASRYSNAVGVWTKIHDDGLGRVYLDGRVSKTFTTTDWNRLDYAKASMEDILIAYGCDPYSISQTGSVLGHPSATASVGKLVDSNLETQIKNLYCCDTSVMPQAPGRPPAMTVVCLAKRLAEHLESIV